MPSLLRYDTIRLLEASVEALHMAVGSLGSEKRVDFRQQTAEHAIEIGLIGAAAELAMSACVIQARGPEAIKWPSGQYKTAGAILEEFRQIVAEPTATSSFLTEGTKDPASQRTLLLEVAKTFRVLIPARAGALHAGRGLRHEVTVIQANDVADFLSLLATSRRLGPYLRHIPRCLWYSQDRSILVEDLRSKLDHTKGADRATTLASIYLVLPDIPDEEPDWLQAFSRVTVSPKERDIEYLMSTLESALPAGLRRATDLQEAVPVQVTPEDPAALPIAPHRLRRQFNKIPDLWGADIATANGRLEQGALHTPPVDAVLDVFALGLEQAGVVKPGERLTAHEAWPHVVSSLHFQGTIGPYWFLVRRCSDLGQLAALLRKAADGRKRLQKRVEDCVHGIEILRNGQQLPRNDPSFASLIAGSEWGKSDKSWLVEREKDLRGTKRMLPSDFRNLLSAVADGGEPVGSLIIELLNLETTRECITYWSRVLAELASEADDVPSLVALLGNQEAVPAHAAARKALSRIDFSIHGPPLLEVRSAE